MWLHNPDWKVLPTISFVDGNPRVLSYKYYDGGCNLKQIHCCRWRPNIPSHVSGQFFHAVVKPWTVTHMKVGYNSTWYQMLEQRSSWKGPYTINLSSFGKTDNSSILIWEAEACSYANRTDMKSILQRLIYDGKMSNDHAEGIEEISNFFQEMLTTWNTNLYQIMFLLKSQYPQRKKKIPEKCYWDNWRWCRWFGEYDTRV